MALLIIRDLTQAVPFVHIAFMVPSLLCLSASIATISSGGFSYFNDIENLINRNLFVTSVVTGSVAYLINLVPAIIIFCLSSRNIKGWKMDKRIEILKEFSLGYNIEASLLQFSNGFSL